MRNVNRLAALIGTISLLVGSAAWGAVNHGDFLGTSVDFLQVTETTTSAGDPEPLWDTPAIAGTGDQLIFFPPNFVSTCTTGLSDTTSSQLTMEIVAQPGGHIDNLLMSENGDFNLTSFPPFGTPDTNASVALTGTLTITEDIGGPIAAVPIPFSGTFSPKATFELPTDFGSSTWDGLVAIDVAGVVANATRATLTFDNVLDTNCGAVGNTVAKIQKKILNGPSVAIMVNPIECSLDLDKTCCVPQPVLPDLDICEGEVVRLELEYTGDKCARGNNDQGRKAKCYGRRKLSEPADITILKDAYTSASPSTGVLKGDVVDLTSSQGTLGDRTKIKTTDVNGIKQYVKIDTSCDRALRCGDRFGAYTVVGLESTLGGYVDCSAPPPDPTCDPPTDPVGTPCDAKVVDMVLEYTGKACQDPLGNPQNGEASCTGDATGATNVGLVYTGKFGYKTQISPASNINDGDRIRVTSTWHGGLFPNQHYLITDSAGVLQEIAFHTSCSQPLALGDEFGSLKLVEFTTKSGFNASLGDGGDGTFDACEVPLTPPKPHCTSDLDQLTLVYIGDYLGQGCTVSNAQGGYASCTGVADPGDPVSVVVDPDLVADPSDQIEFGDLVSITTVSGLQLGWLTEIQVTGAGGTQDIDIKTSCSKPLSLGDRFGSFVVFGMDREDDGPITLGGNVQYQYAVTNPHTTLAVENVSIDDDVLGNIVSGVTLQPGETQTFTETATLFGTTTNVATATGDILGDLCDAGQDSVTVTVDVPPSGSFSCSCSQSLTELTLTWDGSSTVDVKVWDGNVGTSLLTTLDNVGVGDEVTVSGFSANESVWEIYNSLGTIKLGESIFHLTCWDREMNGVEDCGKRAGNGRYNNFGKINDWIIEGMVDDDETLVCSPDVPPVEEECGLGPELMLILPGLLLWHRRRMRSA